MYLTDFDFQIDHQLNQEHPIARDNIDSYLSIQNHLFEDFWEQHCHQWFHNLKIKRKLK